MSRPWLYRCAMLVLSFSLSCLGVFLTENAQSAKPGGARAPTVTVKQAQAVKQAPAANAVQPAVPESATKPVPRPQKAWQDRHNAMNARVKQGNVCLLFIGDSITHGWEKNGKQVWDEYYARRNAVNLGIGGDRTQHVLWRLQNGNIGGICPKLAVIMIGTNNSGSNTPEEIAAGIQAIVELLRAKLPQTKVLILAIFPRGASAEDPRHLVNQKANAIVAKLDDGKMIQYLDIGPKFLIDGKLTKEIMPDRLHLTPAGYKIWAEAIEPAVAKALGPK
jgi:lysophospholipase L1-like esterase